MYIRVSESTFRPSRSNLALPGALQQSGPISYSMRWPECDLETDPPHPARTAALDRLWPKQICSGVQSNGESGSQSWQNVSVALCRNFLACSTDNSVSKTVKKQELLKAFVMQLILKLISGINHCTFYSEDVLTYRIADASILSARTCFVLKRVTKHLLKCKNM